MKKINKSTHPKEEDALKKKNSKLSMEMTKTKQIKKNVTRQTMKTANVHTICKF